MAVLKKQKKQGRLNSLLHMRMNQHKMLSNTMLEMISRNSSKKAIESIKNELATIEKEMSIISEDLANRVNDEEVSYELYIDNEDNGKNCFEKKVELEENEKDGFYDSIIKQTKAYEFLEETKKDDKDVLKDFVEEFRTTADSRTQTNRFLVDLRETLNIPEVMVSSVSFANSVNEVSICIYDFLADTDFGKVPILKILEDSTDKFDFTIKHLDANGKTIYIEKYIGCKIASLYRDSLEYEINNFLKIQILISYDKVVYEASN